MERKRDKDWIQCQIIGVCANLHCIVRNKFYAKELAELKKARDGEYEIFADFTGNKDIASCISIWESYVAMGDIDFANLSDDLALCNLITNIKDQLTRVDLYKYLKSEIKSQIHYLDYGCGSAALSFCFRDFFEQGYFIDVPNVSQDYIRSKINGTSHLHVMTPDDIDLIDNGSLDVVLLWDVLEHLTNPSHVLIAITPKIKSGGQLIWRAPWGNTLLGKHPAHNLHA